MTFTAMCRYLAASPLAQTAILREQKFPRLAHVKNYDDALAQVQRFAISGQPLDPWARELQDHESEVIVKLLGDGWSIPADAATRPPIGKHVVSFHGVAISIHPDLTLIGKRRRKHATGALKFFFPKTYELDPDAAGWMASLLYYHRHEVLQDAIAHPDLCMVYDVRTGQAYQATGRYTALVKQVSEACRHISAIWPGLTK